MSTSFELVTVELLRYLPVMVVALLYGQDLTLQVLVPVVVVVVTNVI
jgi:hypothetical protein